jgi:hypothetical protein
MKFGMNLTHDFERYGSSVVIRYGYVWLLQLQWHGTTTIKGIKVLDGTAAGRRACTRVR